MESNAPTTPDANPERPYNRVAIEVAATIHEHRLDAIRERARTLAAADEAQIVDRLFPEHHRVALGVALEYERMGQQPVSNALQARADTLGLELDHVGLTLGTVIRGIDLKSPLSEDVVRFIQDTLWERKVVFFRDQHLTEDQHVELGERFGDLDAFPFGRPGKNPFILDLRHDRSSPGIENGWHTDVTWMEEPSLGSIAQLIEGPTNGGDTLFADSYAAFLGLMPDVQELVRHLDGINDYRIFVEPSGRNALPTELVAEIKQKIPFGVPHPLARTHPETRKTALYLNAAFLRPESLVDRRTGQELGAKASVELVQHLYAQHARPELQCRFRWEVGSIAFWDNRAVQHYASNDYWPQTRVLRRVTVRGDRPTFDAAADAETAPSHP